MEIQKPHNKYKLPEELKKNRVAAKGAKQISGVTYRQINEWDSKGVLPCRKREKKNNWRQFTGSDVIILSIISALRDMGIPMFKLKKLHDWINQEKTLKFILKYIYQFNSHVYLVTDLEDYYILPDEDVEIHVLALSNKPMLILRLNPIIETVCNALDADYPKVKIESQRNEDKELFKKIKRRIKNNSHQIIELKVRNHKVVNIKTITDKNLDQN